MKSLYDLLTDYLSGRAKTRIYGIFLMWFTAFHIHIIYTALFVSQDLIYEKYGHLKGEYIAETFLHHDSVWFWVWEASTVVFSSALTWLMIWILPKTLLNKSYRREIIDEYERKKLKIQRDQELEDERKKLADSQIKTTEKQVEVIKAQEKVDNIQATAWGSEYEEFKQSQYFQDMALVNESLYRQGGRILVTSSMSDKALFEIPVGSVAYLTANDILTVKDGIASLTEKGKEFMRRYLDDTIDSGSA